MEIRINKGKERCGMSYYALQFAKYIAYIEANTK